MITSKAERCQRWVWAYVTKRPHALTIEIAGATADYTDVEIGRALEVLEQMRYVEQDYSGGRGWYALIPFVVSAPEWARS